MLSENATLTLLYYAGYLTMTVWLFLSNNGSSRSDLCQGQWSI